MFALIFTNESISVLQINIFQIPQTLKYYRKDKNTALQIDQRFIHLILGRPKFL